MLTPSSLALTGLGAVTLLAVRRFRAREAKLLPANPKFIMPGRDQTRPGFSLPAEQNQPKFRIRVRVAA